jgi:hypothetical protein
MSLPWSGALRRADPDRQRSLMAAWLEPDPGRAAVSRAIRIELRSN